MSRIRIRSGQSLQRLSEQVLEESFKLSVSELAVRVRGGLNSKEGISLQDVTALFESSHIDRENVRIAACKLLVSRVPETLEFISKLLKRFRSVRDYEVQFTLFCYLDDMRHLDDYSSYGSVVLRRLEEYLMQVPSPRAHAAWMAGDLLGDHWDPSESLPVLLASARKGRFSAGREGAVNGLGKLFARIRSSEEKEKMIRQFWLSSKKDKSKAVRVAARMAWDKAISK